MPRLAFSTNAFKKTTLEEAIETIAATGYEGVEIMADVPHANPQDMRPQRLTQLRQRLDALGLFVSNINAFTLFACGDTYHPTWLESDTGKRNRRIEHTLRCIGLAARLSSPTISLQPGGPMIGTGLTRRQAGDLFAQGIRAVLPTARENAVTLAIEPEPGLFIQTAEEYLAFKREYFPDEPLVRMNCDLGHLYCVGEDPAGVIRAMPAEVAHIHLEDIGANRVHQHLVPGRGAIDFADIFAALNEIDYRGWVTVELYPYEASAADVARAALEYLRPLARNASAPA